MWLSPYTAGRNPTEAEWAEWIPGQKYKPICG